MLITYASRRDVGAPLRLHLFASLRHLTTLGIRREDPARIWERRTPLTPNAVQALLQYNKSLEIEVESSMKRCYPDQQFRDAGARIVPSLSAEVDLVIGIKEPPVEEIAALVSQGRGRPRTWMVFSHTHKGQAYNTKLLSTLMDGNASQTLIDHELLAVSTASKGPQRVAAFGWFAGAVGLGEALSMTGLALLKRGVAHPLLHLPRPYSFSSLTHYQEALQTTRERLVQSVDASHDPVVIGLTGSGKVSQGAQDMLRYLGVDWVEASDLPSLRSRGNNKIYACVVPPSTYFRRTDGRVYDRWDYYAHPSQYVSTFASEIAPHLTTLINGAGWKPGFPRIISQQQMQILTQDRVSSSQLLAIQDVTCDMKGNLEFIDRTCTIDSPYYEGPGGVLISTIDILPAELPKEASEHFSKCIYPYVAHLTQPARESSKLGQTLDQATVVASGSLASPHKWLHRSVEDYRRDTNQLIYPHLKRDIQQWKKVLMLGSGLVAGPAMKVLARHDVQLVLASNNFAECRNLAKDHTNVTAIALDITDFTALDAVIAEADVVVSLLPASMHTGVARRCVHHGKHLVTASYLSAELKALHEQAVERDVLILGECGLDPGIDSMAAMRILHRVRGEKKKVTSFVSWCGGLPEPDASNVLMGYKFSWSPRAVLLAAQNEARYKLEGKTRFIKAQNLLSENFPDVRLWKGLALEGLANRDSLPYADKYRLGKVEHLRDLFRGTLRYRGFSTQLDAFRRLGLLSSCRIRHPIENWQDLLATAINLQTGEEVTAKTAEAAARQLLVDLDIPVIESTLAALRWLSMLDRASEASRPAVCSTPLEYFADLLARRLSYQPHERDTTLLHHSFRVAAMDGAMEEQVVSASLILYGDDKNSAMATTVGKTLGFAALRVLDGHVKTRGVIDPCERDVWEGVLNDLDEAGIHVKENWGS